MKPLTRQELNASCVEDLGLDPEAVNLTSVEAIAALLRYTASFLCPVPSRMVSSSVLDALRGATEETDGLKDLVEDTLSALVAHGDLIEQIIASEEPETGSSGTLLYLAPPSFVLRASGAVLVLGVPADGASALPSRLNEKVEYWGHVRLLNSDTTLEEIDALRDLGFVELAAEYWMKPPQKRSADEFLASFGDLLDSSGRSGEVLGLSIIETDHPVRYYRGRWTEAVSRTGRFVARRPRSYGAEIWCYVELDSGVATRLLDLPATESGWRGCDVAWRLQAAIDAVAGHPQVLELRKANEGHTAIQLFSPIPSWAQRRWDAIGEPVIAAICLLSYRFADGEIEEELRFASEWLWLSEERA